MKKGTPPKQRFWSLRVASFFVGVTLVTSQRFDQTVMYIAAVLVGLFSGVATGLVIIAALR